MMASHGTSEKIAQRTSDDRVDLIVEWNAETKGAEITQVYGIGSFQS